MSTAGKFSATGCITVVFLYLFTVSSFSDNWDSISGGFHGRINVIEPETGTNTLYIGTDHGLYKSDHPGGNLNRVDVSFDAAPVEDIALSGDDIYIATKGSLYIGRKLLKWERVRGLKYVKGVASDPQDEGRVVVAHDERRIFLIGSNGVREITPEVFRGRIGKVKCGRGAVVVSAGSDVWRSLDMGSTWKKLAGTDRLADTDTLYETDEVPEAGSEEELSALLRVRDIDTDGVVTAVATREGIHLVRGDGQPAFIDTEGLPSEDVEHVAVRGDVLFAATDTRVFSYDEGTSSWHTVFDKAATGGIRGIVIVRDSGGSGRLHVAGRYKVFSSEIISLLPGDIEKPLNSGDVCPSIQEVHRMAIEYAEVSPEKIKSWRRGARWKALMPKLSVGISQSIDDNIEIYKNSSTWYVVDGPEETGTDWDVDLTWDLSDLVWNSEQTSIDVRSKLMVQLRDEILEEVTRLYYERKRLVEEAEEAGKEVPAKKRIRIEEITAYIDAYTGGGFSSYGKGS